MYLYSQLDFIDSSCVEISNVHKQKSWFTNSFLGVQKLNYGEIWKLNSKNRDSNFSKIGNPTTLNWQSHDFLNYGDRQ